MADASDFKFRTQPWFAQARHNIPPRRKSGLSPGLGASQHLGFSFNIYATAEASNFMFRLQLGFAKAHR